MDNFITNYGNSVGGILLSQKSIKILLDNYDKIIKKLYEDKAIGDFLYNNGILLIDPESKKKIDDMISFNVLSDENIPIVKDFMNLYNINNKDEITNNQKIEFRFFCYKYLDYIKNIKFEDCVIDSKYEAVLIEYRCFPHLEFLIRNMIIKLGKDWSQTIICGNLNFDYITNMCKNICKNIKVILTPYDNLNPSTYSKLLASVDFWNLFVGEKILIYQEDSCIFKSNIDDFLMWDYIGAPWPVNQNDTPKGVVMVDLV
jgi:hypothetical protein